MNLLDTLTLVTKGIDENFSSKGFSLSYPDGIKKGELPLVETEAQRYVEYKGEKGVIRIVYADGKLSLLTALPPEEGDEPDFANISVSLFDEETMDDKEIKYLINEYNDCINEKFREKKTKGQVGGVKIPAPVSKAAAKSGASFYDANTFANRYTQIYPELRDSYKENIEKYGEFLPDEFFTIYGKAAINTIRTNDKQQMKKLFNLLNDIYLDGTNETQSLIAVTLLGQLNNDQVLLANCIDYMDPDLAKSVIYVNQYLGSRSSKRARKLLENPPRYKPKKKKGFAAMS